MDWLVIGFVAVQAIVIAIVLAQALARGRSLDAIREATGGAEGGDDLGARVRRLIERAETADWEAGQQHRDTAYLADLIGVGIVHVDDESRVDLANRAAHAFLDRAAGAMLGRTAIEAFVDRRIEVLIEDARERGSASGEVAIGDADGMSLVVRARRSPVRGVWVVLEDVTELRRLQQIRAEFIDNLSHELRTPLTTVSLLAETLAREAAEQGDAIPERMRDRIGKIEVETGHIAQMVNELLDLSRIESGGAVVHLDDVDLGALATASTERLRLFAERQGVRLAVEAAADLPPVRGDEARLGQVLVNLLHNAVKFSPAGGDVTVLVAIDGREVVTSVEDRGVGIPKALLGRVFERFYKADRARVRGGGTGLGLSIARHVVEQHGGRIWVESEEGEGIDVLVRPSHRGGATGMSDALHVATLNIRNIADRWEERLPLLLADMRALQPDVLGLQEVVYPMEQDRLLGAAGEARYRAIRAWAGRPEYGNSLLVREPFEATADERLELDHNRSAIRVVMRLPGGSRLLYAATHLHHVPADESVRDEQAARLVEWLDAAPSAAAQVLVGDFNAEPDEPACARLRAAGFRSAYLEANGAEPAVTWPSGIQAPGMDTDGEAGCLDYIWLRGAVRAVDARLTFDRPGVTDPTLYPSDHLGLAAHVVVGE